MLTLALPTRVYLYVPPTDMRRGFDTLAALVRDHLGHDPLAGSLFVFRSRRGDRLKLLWWDDDGYALFYKRLEEGTFRFPAVGAGQAGVEIRSADLALILEGIDLDSVRRSKRYHRPVPA